MRKKSQRQKKQEDDQKLKKVSNALYPKLVSVCHELLLKNNKILTYLKKNRKITDKTINKYKLGAFPKDLRDLYIKHSLDPVELRKYNIIYDAEQSQFKFYPIVIPIMNTLGHPIAIGCRVIMDNIKRGKIGIPKYRNTVYKKASHLFGLHIAKEYIRSNNLVFVVEGYFDVITAHQNGILNVVAPCGLMFSDRQLITLTRYTNNICLLFDNDNPGRTSARKIVDKIKLFDSNINIMCKFVPDGFNDIDEYIMKGENINFLLENFDA